MNGWFVSEEGWSFFIQDREEFGCWKIPVILVPVINWRKKYVSRFVSSKRQPLARTGPVPANKECYSWSCTHSQGPGTWHGHHSWSMQSPQLRKDSLVSCHGRQHQSTWTSSCGAAGASDSDDGPVCWAVAAAAVGSLAAEVILLSKGHKTRPAVVTTENNLWRFGKR